MVKCAVDEFVAQQCSKDIFMGLKDFLYEDVSPVVLALTGCGVDAADFPSVELPEGYGVVEPVQCEAELVCNVSKVETCLWDDLVFDNDCG